MTFTHGFLLQIGDALLSSPGGSSPANDPWDLSTVPSPWWRTCPPLDTHLPTSAPVQAPALGPHPRGSFCPTRPLPHSCILNLTLWIPPLSRPQMLDSTCPGLSAAPPMAPALLPALSECLGPSPSSHQSQAPWCPESPPYPHPGRPSSSVFTLTQDGGVHP